VVSRFLDASGPVAFAHRGFAAGVPENSMAAFQRAVDLGYRYLETDARVTADGVAVAFHDILLDRLTDLRGRLARRPWEEVRRARIGGTEPIPRLADVLAAWPDCFVNVDVKSDGAVPATLNALTRTHAADRVCIAAFSDRRLAVLREALGPGVCTGLGPLEISRLRMASWRQGPAQPVFGARRAAQVPMRIGPVPFVDTRLVAAAHDRGLAVHVWTVNDAADMRTLLDLGVDGVMTDRADVLRAILEERGAWPTR
jgi:glycerophosphoryl diester phosphodiesterase